MEQYYSWSELFGTAVQCSIMYDSSFTIHSCDMYYADFAKLNMFYLSLFFQTRQDSRLFLQNYLGSRLDTMQVFPQAILSVSTIVILVTITNSMELSSTVCSHKRNVVSYFHCSQAGREQDDTQPGGNRNVI